jgi:hypothetical protein
MREHKNYHPWYEGIWHFRHERKGKIIWEADVHNTLVNEGERDVLDVYFRNSAAAPTSFFARLCRDTIFETSVLTTIVNEPSGNNYSPIEIERSAMGFPTIELDAGDWRVVSKEIGWTALGGSIGPVNTCFLATSLDNTGKLIAFLNLPLERTILDGDTLYAFLRIKAK